MARTGKGTGAPGVPRRIIFTMGPHPNNLYAARMAAGVLGRDVAGITGNTYRRLERGLAPLTDKYAALLAPQFRCSIAQLRAEAPPPVPRASKRTKRREPSLPVVYKPPAALEVPPAVRAALPAEVQRMLDEGHSFERPEAPLPIADLLVVLSTAAAVPPARWPHAIKILRALCEP